MLDSQMDTEGWILTAVAPAGTERREKRLIDLQDLLYDF